MTDYNKTSYKKMDSEVSVNKQSRKKTKRWLIRAIIYDFVLAAFALYFFSMYYFLLPRDLSKNATVLPGSLQSGLITEGKEVSENQLDLLDSLHNIKSPELTWKEKYADKFTDGNVEQTDNSYKSDKISISIQTVQRDGVTYYIADIYLADIKYFKTAFAKDRFGSGMHDSTLDIARQKKAVLAINGDYSGTNSGPVVRNGVMYREEIYQDSLVLSYDGSMNTYTAQTIDMEKIKQDGAYQVWTFGPMLLENGKPMEEFNSTLNPANPRTAVGYYEPGHYCFVVVDGRQPGYSNGYTLKQMSQLFYDIGCKVAFNLDGGQSSEMVFQGKFVNRPYKGGRGTSDILYIADE